MNLEVILKYPSILLLAFLVTFLSTPLIMWVARRLNVMKPNRSGERIPAAGGVAIFLGFHAGAACLFSAPWLPFAGQIEIGWWHHFLLLSGLLLVVGLVDDCKRMRAFYKLASQVAVALAAFHFDIRMGNVLGQSPPYLFDLVLTTGWFLLLINAFKLIDGLDGLATGLAIVAALGIGLSLVLRQTPGDVLIFLALIGACLAFLWYNFQPARIYLGESGSMFLGFTLAALSLSTQSKGPALAVIGFPLVAMGIPLIDTLLAVWRRSVRSGAEEEGRLTTLAEGDEDHLHHRMMSGGLSQRRTALTLYGLALGATMLGLLMLAYRSKAQGMLLISFVVITYVVFRHLASVELRRTGAAALRGFSRPTRRNMGIWAYPLLDVGCVVVALSLAIVLNPYGPESFVAFKKYFFRLAPLCVGIPLLVLAKVKAYSRLWSMARISDILQTGFAAAAGGMLGFGIYLFSAPQSSQVYVVMAFVHDGLCLVLVAANRSLGRIIKDVMASRSERKTDHRAHRRTLLIGGSGQITMFLGAMTQIPDTAFNAMVVVGIVDSDRNVQGRIVHGIPVLGTVNELGALLDNTFVQQLVLVGDLYDEEWAKIQEVVKDRSIQVARWTSHLDTDFSL